MARAKSLKRLTETEAREMLEAIHWPSGAVCPHCGNCDKERIWELKGKATRAGLYKCKECRKQFTVTVGTIFERSKVPLADWIYVFHAMCASKKGVSALQISRELSCQYKTAWFMCHRIRYAMNEGPLSQLLSGTVEADETFVGGKPRVGDERVKYAKTDKTPVVTLVERGGRAKSRAVTNITAKTLRAHIDANVAKSSTLMTDEFKAYKGIAKQFEGGHFTTKHSIGEYAKGANNEIHSNTAESFFSLLKRGVYGTFHHMSKQHLQRYCDEFDFRWNHRKVTDNERTFTAMQQATGKRLMYRKPKG